MVRCDIFVVVFCMGLLKTQAPPTAAKPDSEQVKALIEKAKKTGGQMWAYEEHFFCEAPRANSPNDPPIEPMKIFDNVYVIGNQGTVAYVIETSDGLMMIDSLPADQTDTQLLPGLQKLGLDPAKVKMIVVGHGHADHFGGRRIFRDTTDQRSTLPPRIGILWNIRRLEGEATREKRAQSPCCPSTTK